MILGSKLNKNSATFTALIKIDANIKAPTVIYASTKVRGDGVAWYPNGFNSEITD